MLDARVRDQLTSDRVLKIAINRTFFMQINNYLNRFSLNRRNMTENESYEIIIWSRFEAEVLQSAELQLFCLLNLCDLCQMSPGVFASIWICLFETYTITIFII